MTNSYTKEDFGPRRNGRYYLKRDSSVSISRRDYDKLYGRFAQISTTPESLRKARASVTIDEKIRENQRTGVTTHWNVVTSGNWDDIETAFNTINSSNLLFVTAFGEIIEGYGSGEGDKRNYWKTILELTERKMIRTKTLYDYIEAKLGSIFNPDAIQVFTIQWRKQKKR